MAVPPALRMWMKCASSRPRSWRRFEPVRGRPCPSARFGSCARVSRGPCVWVRASSRRLRECIEHALGEFFERERRAARAHRVSVGACPRGPPARTARSVPSVRADRSRAGGSSLRESHVAGADRDGRASRRDRLGDHGDGVLGDADCFGRTKECVEDAPWVFAPPDGVRDGGFVERFAQDALGGRAGSSGGGEEPSRVFARRYGVHTRVRWPASRRRCSGGCARRRR